MATISENLQTLATAKANIKSAIEGKGQDLTDVPFTEYADKISAIESGGSSVECDLVDVTQLSGNVQDDKIYRIAGQSGDYYVSFVGTAGGDTAQFTTLSDFLTMLGVSVSIKDEISVNGIDGVTEPILSDENGLFIYTDTSTYIGYVFGDFEGTGVVDKMTISDFVNMMNTLTGGNYPTLTDNGSKEDISDITEDGVFYISEKTIIGVPNATNNKNIMQYDGAEWKEVGAGGGTDRLQWKCDNTKALYYEFYNYKGTDLSILEGLDTSQVTDMSYAFQGCNNLEVLPEIDTSNCKNLSHAFGGCSKLTDLSFVKTDKATNISYAFQSCRNLSSELSLNLENCTNVSYAFAEAGLPKITLLNTDKITSFYYLFNYCRNLKEVNTLDLSSATSASTTFQTCSVLEKISVTNTQQVTNWAWFAQNCSKVKTIETIDLFSATNTGAMFNFCSALENLTLKNVKINTQIGSGTSFGHLLTNASLLNTAQELWDNTNNVVSSSTLRLTLSTPSKTAIKNIYVKLVDVTDEMIAEDEYIANKKPCVECASTDEGAMTLEEYIISKNWSIA